MPDIDIDFADRNAALAGLVHTVAVQTMPDGRYSHGSGVYFQEIPVDPLDGMAVWDYKAAADKGYLKLDFLNNTIYSGVRDEAHLDALLAAEPPWHLLMIPEVVENLMQIGNHYSVVQKIAPQSIDDLAVCIAVIRPGKSHLKTRSRAEIIRDIWKPEADGYLYKRSHAIAFATSIVVQLNLLIETLSHESAHPNESAN